MTDAPDRQPLPDPQPLHDRLTEDEVLKLLTIIDVLSRNAAKHDGDRTDTVRKRLMNALRDALRGE